MKKIFKFKKISALIAMLLCVFTFAACTPNTPVTPVPPGPGPGPVDPVDPPDPGYPDVPDPGNKPINELFSKYKIIHSGGSDLLVQDPVTGTTQKFDYLVDRQISVFAEDLLVRLFQTYGNGPSISMQDDSYNLGVNYNTDEAGSAIVIGRNVISMTKEIELTPGNPLYVYFDKNNNQIEFYNDNPDFNDAAHYAHNFNDDRSWVTTTVLARAFNLTNAINGGQNYISGGIFAQPQYHSNNEQYEWRWNYNSISAIDFTAYMNKYLNQLKLDIAKILIGQEINDNLSQDAEAEYETLLGKVPHLGFTAQNKAKIETYIYNYIIGANVVNNDNGFASDLIDLFKGTVINNQVSTQIDAKNIELHYYKAYSVIIPEILERALGNCFGGKEVDRIIRNAHGDPIRELDGTVTKTPIENIKSVHQDSTGTYYSLYPKMGRSGDYDIDIEPVGPVAPGQTPDLQYTGFREIKTIILQPKDGSFVTNLVMAIRAEADVEVIMKVKVNYVVDGFDYGDAYVPVDLARAATIVDKHTLKFTGPNDPYYEDYGYFDYPHTYSLRIDTAILSPKPYPIFKEFNGFDGGFDLWNNNPFGISSYNAGTNYLALTFEFVSVTKNGQPTNQIPLLDVGFMQPM